MWQKNLEPLDGNLDMVDFVVTYLSLMLENGTAFLVLLLPFGVLYFFYSQFRLIYLEGVLRPILWLMFFLFGGFGLAFYTYTKGGPWWLCLLIALVGMQVGFKVNERLMSKKNKDEKD